MDGSDALALLQETDALNKLRDRGYQGDEFTILAPENGTVSVRGEYSPSFLPSFLPSPLPPPFTNPLLPPAEALPVGMIAGVVVVVGAMGLVAVLVVVVIVLCCIRCSRNRTK